MQVENRRTEDQVRAQITIKFRKDGRVELEIFGDVHTADGRLAYTHIRRNLTKILRDRRRAEKKENEALISAKAKAAAEAQRKLELEAAKATVAELETEKEADNGQDRTTERTKGPGTGQGSAARPEVKQAGSEPRQPGRSGPAKGNSL